MHSSIRPLLAPALVGALLTFGAVRPRADITVLTPHPADAPYACSRDDPAINRNLNNEGRTLAAEGRYAEAEQTLRTSLALRERNYGEDHPCVATVLNNLGNMMGTLARYDEAITLLDRSIEIRNFGTNLGSRSGSSQGEGRQDGVPSRESQRRSASSGQGLPVIAPAGQSHPVAKIRTT